MKMRGMTSKGGVYGFKKFSEYKEPMEVKALKKRMVQLERQIKELKRENWSLRKEAGEPEDGVLINRK